MGELADDLYRDLGMGAGEANRHRRAEALEIVVGHAEADASARLVVGNGVQRLVLERAQAPRIADEDLAGGSQGDAAARAVEQPLADPLLQPLDDDTDGGLGLTQRLGRRGEAA